MAEEDPQNRDRKIKNLVRQAVREAGNHHASPVKIRRKISDLRELRALANEHLEAAQLSDVHTQLDLAGTLLHTQLERDPMEAAWRIAGSLCDIEQRAMHPDLNQIFNVREAWADLQRAERKLAYLRLNREAKVSGFCEVLIDRLNTLKIQLSQLALDQGRQTSNAPLPSQDVGPEGKGFVRRLFSPKRIRPHT
jgi:hypothetical protein